MAAFRGSYGGKDAYPVWRDAEATDPNLGPVVLERLRAVLGEDVGPEEVIKYLYGLGGTAAYSDRFREELGIAAGPVRLPVTKDRALFHRVAAVGEELLAWHTWGERFSAEPMELGPARETSVISGRPDSFSYDSATQTLRVGSGTIQPVSSQVWDFEVSGMKPLQKWLGYRMAKRQGRTSSPLDAISYDEWTFTDELLLAISALQRTVDLAPRSGELIDLVLAGPLFTAEEIA
jgi:hypothetical protein